MIIDFGLARRFELSGERFDLTTVVKEEKANDRLIRAGELYYSLTHPRENPRNEVVTLTFAAKATLAVV